MLDVETAYIFDVDGPLSDPKERRVVELALFDEIVARLRAGEPVALNSGRSINWMQAEVVAHVTQRLDGDQGTLQRFLVIGEKGGAWLTFDKSGNAQYGRDSELAVPPFIKTAVDNLVQEKYSDCVADLDPKTTMISLEMLPGYPLDQFAARKQILATDLGEILDGHNLENKFRVDTTTIAVDIESPDAGKDRGIQRILEFLHNANITTKRYEIFGDSRSDEEMARELVRQKPEAELTYVFVGDEKDAPRELAPTCRVVMPGRFSAGTLLHLTAQLSSKPSP